MVAKVTGSRCSSSGAKERAGERLSKNDRQPRNQPHVIRIREDRNRRIPIHEDGASGGSCVAPHQLESVNVHPPGVRALPRPSERDAVTTSVDQE